MGSVPAVAIVGVIGGAIVPVSGWAVLAAIVTAVSAVSTLPLEAVPLPRTMAGLVEAIVPGPVAVQLRSHTPGADCQRRTKVYKKGLHFRWTKCRRQIANVAPRFKNGDLIFDAKNRRRQIANAAPNFLQRFRSSSQVLHHIMSHF